MFATPEYVQVVQAEQFIVIDEESNQLYSQNSEKQSPSFFGLLSPSCFIIFLLCIIILLLIIDRNFSIHSVTDAN